MTHLAMIAYVLVMVVLGLIWSSDDLPFWWKMLASEWIATAVIGAVLINASQHQEDDDHDAAPPVTRPHY